MAVKEIRIPLVCTMTNALLVVGEVESEGGFSGMRIVCDDGSQYRYHSGDAKKVLQYKMTLSDYMSVHRIKDEE